MARRRTPVSLRQQLQAAYEVARERDGLTLVVLAEKAGLDLSESSLYRKLYEEQTLRSDEIEKLARALCVEVTAGRGEVA